MAVRIARGSSAFRAVSDRVNNGAEQALLEIGAEAQRLIVEHLHEGRDAAGHQGRFDEGLAARSVVARNPSRTARGWDLVVEVQGPRAEIMPVIEEGRRPGRPVSVAGMERLRRWVRRKLAVEEKDADDVAFLVARKIRREGIPGIAPFARAARILRAGKAARILQQVIARRGAHR